MTTGTVHAASAWIYRGVWRVLVDWFRVPAEPPTLPAFAGDRVASFRPSEGFLRYMKFSFWLLLLIVDGALMLIWLAVTAASPFAGAVIALPMLALILLPEVAAYIAIHLR